MLRNNKKPNMGAVVRHTSANPLFMRPALRYVAVFLASLAIIAMASAHQAEANPRYAAYVMDANTGQVLFSRNGDAARYPASLTKMMTAYMIFEAIETGKVSKQTQIPVSAKAAAEVPSKLGLRAGSRISVHDAILALVTRSANDVATAVGEFLGGSEQEFTRMMTARARQLGMSSTTFRNAHGLPNNQQKTTARDMAILGIALREHFPQHYSYFSTRHATIHGTRYNSHNRVLGRVTGADGIKTGYIRASGFNLVSSVQSEGRSIVAVVMGGRTGASRDNHMVELIRAHLPRASRSKSGPLLAARGAPSNFIASIGQALPSNNIPTPSFRPVEVAQAPAQAQASTVVAAAKEPGIIQPNAFAATASANAASAAIRPPMPVGNEGGEEATAALVEQGSVDDVTTASIPQSGWAVQVAAAPSEAEANGVLDAMTSRVPNILGSRKPFTETFTRNGTVYYRARFGGFGSSQEAWNACNALKSNNIDCFAAEL